MVNKKIYTFSFTGASAMITETLIVAEEYDRLKDWDAVKKSVLDNNLLNKIKLATFTREFREIKKRLSQLTSDQLNVLVYGNMDDAKAMILLSLAKTYILFKDFIIEVLRHKYLLFDTSLTEIDYIKFINSKYFSNPELNEITAATASKVKQRIYTLFEQIGLITQIKDGAIIKPVLSKKVVDVIIEDDSTFLTIFLYSNEEIKSLLQKSKYA